MFYLVLGIWAFVTLTYSLPSTRHEIINAKYPLVHICVTPSEMPLQILPYFFGQLENLDYPKNRISIQISINDETSSWFYKYRAKARKLYFTIESAGTDDVDYFICSREALAVGAQYAMILTPNVILTNPRSLQILMEEIDKPIVAAMLKYPNTNYSNFAATEIGQYDQTYLNLVNYELVGVTRVRQVWSAVLIDAQRLLTTTDQPATFLVNRAGFGFVLPHTESYVDSLNDLIMMLLRDGVPPLLHTPLVSRPLPDATTHHLDQIYVINLERRPDRRRKMEYAAEYLGLKVQFWQAVDGQSLNESRLKKLGVRLLPEYRDPYHDRPMKMGEIGCFLSHYNIWREVVEKDYDKVLILEDDALFENYFIRNLHESLADIANENIDWDLIYLGRKRMAENDEFFISDVRHLSNVTYSYWTIGYLLSQSGARKLIATDPLSKMIALDEFLPIVYGKHPNKTLASHFPTVGTFTAYSFWPFLVRPSHYTYENDYITDTESSNIVDLNSLTGMHESINTRMPNIAETFTREEL